MLWFGRRTIRLQNGLWKKDIYYIQILTTIIFDPPASERAIRACEADLKETNFICQIVALSSSWSRKYFFFFYFYSFLKFLFPSVRDIGEVV